MSLIKSLAKDWLPPAILRAIRHRRGGGIRFEGNYATWEEAAARCTGYDAAPILAKVLDATLKVKRGEAAFERDSVLFDEIAYAWPVTAGLMWAAAKSGGRLDVLDFGGALGSSYFQNRAFLAGLPQVRWSVVEQAHYVEAGREHVQDDNLRFYASVDDCLAENKPNIILISSVLEYLSDYISCIENICEIKSDVILIDRALTSRSGADVIVIQHVIWEFLATLPCRLLSRTKLLGTLSNLGYEMMIQYPSLGGDGENHSYQGFIFRKVK